ncbi:PAS domain S-box-containing protein [Kineococcus radiotolerans]|uniref:PAS domain S-box-containing protein n=1 Tax=Kineococcus radiotolerans TaxID=131568 RepID=A0A7W4XXA8_KINRA|nr:PP2C family protein-serine/threonine phosphatase [Kineococcus radiotolerans]MBB2900990.1 PAS domain S-box-containing protein [Kineococcus radiotolerans]
MTWVPPSPVVADGVSITGTGAGSGVVLDEVLLRALRAVQQAVCISDLSLQDEPVVWVNDAFTLTTGYLAAETVGRNCRFLQDGLSERGHDTTRPAARIRALLRERRSGTVVIPNRRRDGSVFLNELSLSPLTEPDGSVRYYVAVQRDVTARVEAQNARDNAHAEARALADELQRHLVPHRLPEVPWLDVAVRYQPATRPDGTRGEVSGDFYDLRTLPGGEVVAVIGDVSGRGPRAAAATAALRWAVRGAAGATSEPAALLSLVSDAVQDALDERFATVAALRLRRAATEATVALAGHPQLLLLPADGEPRFVGTPGTLLGPFPEVELHDAVVDLPPGSSLLLYTDGVTEAADASHRLLGEDGLLAAVAGLTSRRSDDVADAVLAAVARHVGEGPTDDLTLMVVSRRPG